jgi:L-ascorbate metabolism protein UlaG (beta-lactamase superfamily)
MILNVVVILVVVYILFNLFMRYYLIFGGTTSKEEIQAFSKSENFAQGKFSYPIPTPMDMDLKNTLKVMKEFALGGPRRKPSKPIPVTAFNPLDSQNKGQARITWFGHSAFLLELEGKTILIDPMFGRAPSPFPIFGNKRYSRKLPLAIEQMPLIDAIIFSHDHYDHLDYGSIMKLKNKVKMFFVPLGVSKHLERWGIDKAKINELDWWNEAAFEGISLVCAPARHFSGRKLNNRDSTLWCSWVIKGEEHTIYYSGDSGYGPHFEEIGKRFGPFDLTLMECGQYDKRWASIHMMPEETVQAQLDVRGQLMIPIHWGAFTLSLHEWTDPVERICKAAKEQNVAVATPRIGESVQIGSSEYPRSTWWREV